MRAKLARTAFEYGVITVATLLLVVGVYFFKFPNNFSFGGVTGIAVVLSAVSKTSASSYTFIINMALLVLGFLFLGKNFGAKTVYVSVLTSVGLSALEKWFPMSAPLTTEPVLELIFAIFLPALSAAILFNIGASGGGTDIIAMILKKYTSVPIGTALFIVDCLIVVASCFVFDIQTGLFSLTGLLAKSLVIDNVIESINLCKVFMIVCDDPEPICEFIYQGGIEGLLLSTMAAGTAAAIFSVMLKAEPSKSKYEKHYEQGEHSIKQLLSVMKHPKAFLFASALSIFQVSWLLINFFYVEKLGECGISPEWMSAVILGYSAVEMLAEPIIRKLGISFSKKWARRFGILCGVGFLVFGFVSKRIFILPLMLILPLLLKLPEYFVMEQENVLVDLLGVKTQRVAALSILNMGVSIIEILALFASAALTAVGIGWCFLGVGVLLIICMLCIFGIDNQ